MSAIFQRHFTLRPSKYFSFFIFVVCCISLSILAKLPMSPGLQILLGLLAVIASSFVLLRDARLSLAFSCIAFRLDGERVITMMMRDGRHLNGKLTSGGVVLPSLVLLNIRLEGGRRRSLVLLRSSMSNDNFRRLRIMLRWGDGSNSWDAIS